jgi:hypothetical protein
MIHASAHSPKLKSPPVPVDVQNDREKYSAWWKQWSETDEGQAWRRASEENQRLRDASPSFSASVDRDGTFRIDDIPAGDYKMSLYFQNNDVGRLNDYEFSVPANEDGNAGQPVDLGAITLSPVLQQ